MRVSLIAAIASNGVIGRGSELPWRLRADLKSFKAKTLGHHVILGRKTFESFGGRPLPGRPHVIVSRDPAYSAPEGCTVVPSVDAALAVAHADGEQEAMIIGGAQIYTLALPHAETFYRTRVLADVEGDVYFPHFEESHWRVVHSEGHPVDENNQYPFILETLTRENQP